MSPIRRRNFIIGSSAFVVLGSGCKALAQGAPTMTPHEQELYEAAKKDGGELTWYTAQSDDITAQALGRSFEQLYPGLKVNVLRTTAQVAYQRVTQEIKASAVQCDVFSSTDIGHSVELKAKGVFEKYVPDNASKVLDIYKGYDPDGYYFVTSKLGLVIQDNAYQGHSGSYPDIDFSAIPYQFRCREGQPVLASSSVVFYF